MDCNNKPKNVKDPSQRNCEEITEVPVSSIMTSITSTFQSTDVSYLLILSASTTQFYIYSSSRLIKINYSLKSYAIS